VKNRRKNGMENVRKGKCKEGKIQEKEN